MTRQIQEDECDGNARTKRIVTVTTLLEYDPVNTHLARLKNRKRSPQHATWAFPLPSPSACLPLSLSFSGISDCRGRL